ncbi:hypothetical protein [Desulfobacter sp.]|uniref:hypothetical protein n=1 Tax=Desulfobacter sp. TaxID=2294 RepID=UPI00257AD74E|nr:hypothetical protein [Desulfobacter sp.]
MIVKSENKSNFTILSNAVLLDETISDKARGTLIFNCNGVLCAWIVRTIVRG